MILILSWLSFFDMMVIVTLYTLLSNPLVALSSALSILFIIYMSETKVLRLGYYHITSSMLFLCTRFPSFFPAIQPINKFQFMSAAKNSANLALLEEFIGYQNFKNIYIQNKFPQTK
jgi:hypothetical protein